MKLTIFNCAFLLLLLSSCGKEEKKANDTFIAPKVSKDGSSILFKDTTEIDVFKTEHLSAGNLTAQVTAPAKVAATILSSDSGASQNIVLFDNPDLAGSYTQLLQHQINIKQIAAINVKQRKIELERVKDLQKHGAATGQDLLNAQTALSMEETNLANEKAAIIEHETKLKAGGFDPAVLEKAQAGIAYLICDIAENQLQNIKESGACSLTFNAYPGETFSGRIDAIADAVDNATRMIKVRITLNNGSGKFRAGMFANVSFGISEGNTISVSKYSVITVQGNSYVFIKTAPDRFERKLVQTGSQFGDRIVILSGVKSGDVVATEGVIQLKGLSFGY